MSLIDWQKNLYLIEINNFIIKDYSFNKIDYFKKIKEIGDYIFFEFSKTYSKNITIFNNGEKEVITYQSIKTANLIYNKEKNILIINVGKVFSEYILRFLKRNSVFEYKELNIDFEKIITILNKESDLNPIQIKVNEFELNKKYICDADIKTKSNSYLKELFFQKKKIQSIKLSLDGNEITLEKPMCLKINNLNLDFFYFIDVLIKSLK